MFEKGDTVWAKHPAGDWFRTTVLEVDLTLKDWYRLDGGYTAFGPSLRTRDPAMNGEDKPDA